MKNLDKVAAYFNNELSDSEKNNFLNEVESNSELKNEFDFQEEVINGIKEARKAELKAMLDKVSISVVSTASTGLYKVLYGGAATILLGTALWYYTNSENILEAKTEHKTAVVDNTTKTATALNENKTVSESPSKPTAQEFETKNKGTKKIESTPIITPNVPTSEDGIDSNLIAEENLDIPESVSNSSINLSSKVNVEVKLKKKYNFHYQYSDKGIVLYGDFKEGLFEILELNKELSASYYLFFQGNYYYIKDKSGKINPLKPVNDKSLKLKLEALR